MFGGARGGSRIIVLSLGWEEVPVFAHYGEGQFWSGCCWGGFPRLAPQLSSLHWLTFLRGSEVILSGLLFEMKNQSKCWFSLCPLLSLAAPRPSCTVSAAVHLMVGLGQEPSARSQVSGLSDSVFLM